MSSQSKKYYEFGQFRFYYEERILQHAGQTVQLRGRPKDVLEVLLERGCELGISKTDLMIAVWGNKAGDESNLFQAITALRNKLAEYDNQIAFIETIPEYGYRFVAEVKHSSEVEVAHTKSSAPAVSQTEAGSRLIGQTLLVESHKFVPVYLGLGAFAALADVPEKSNQWTIYKEIVIGGYRLCIFAFGIGVWHIVEQQEFESLVDLAIWRRKTYKDILRDRQHDVIGYTQEFVAKLAPDSTDPLENLRGQPGYVFSLFVLTKSAWTDKSEVLNAMRLLSCPKALLLNEDVETLQRDEALLLERNFLQHGFHNPDLREFGLPGTDSGYASWAGLSYFSSLPARPSFIDTIVEFELAVQSLWWFCSCAIDLGLSSSDDIPTELKAEINQMNKRFGKLRNIGPTESTQQRTMVEAVLVTSRLQELVTEVITLHK
jgi:DNA-binding winged helix-turn-helix (wHTH) protein